MSHHLIDIRSNRKLVHKNILSNLSIVNVIDSIMYQAEQGWVITNKNSFCYNATKMVLKHLKEVSLESKLD